MYKSNHIAVLLGGKLADVEVQTAFQMFKNNSVEKPKKSVCWHANRETQR